MAHAVIAKGVLPELSRESSTRKGFQCSCHMLQVKVSCLYFETVSNFEAKCTSRLPALAMWTKLRPFVREFLAATHKFTEMHIYTHGDQEYAAAMAKLLDPQQKYFQGRIVSQVSLSFYGVTALYLLLQ